MGHVFKSLALITTLGLLVSACGGGGGGGGSDRPPPNNAAVGGLWFGTTEISGQGESDLFGIVAENGRAYFFQEDGVMYWGTVRSSGNQITSTLTGAGLFGSPLWDGSSSGTGSVSGVIQARTSIAANSTFTTAFGGTTTSTISLLYDSQYDDDSSLALIAGTYFDMLGFYTGVLNISGNGDLFLQDPGSGCVINGRIAVINAAFNAYDIRYSYNNCAFAVELNGATFIGLAAYDLQSGQLLAFAQGPVGGAPFPDVLIFARQ